MRGRKPVHQKSYQIRQTVLKAKRRYDLLKMQEANILFAASSWQ